MASSLFPNQNQPKSNNNLSLDTVKAMVGRRNPKEVFFELCKQKNVNPEDILKQLK